MLIFLYMSISSIVPLHYRDNVNDYLRVRSVIVGIAAIALIQFIIAIAYLILQSNVLELVLNLSTAIYALSSIYFLRYFKTLEGYLNMVLGGFYIYLFALIVMNGGIYADYIFWLAILLLVNILFTKLKHIYFWTITVLLFITTLYVASMLGIKFEQQHFNETFRLLSLATFFSPLLISGLVFSSNCRKNSLYQERLLTRLERIKQKQEDLVDEITHDLKSPTNRILGLLQLFDKSNLKEDQLEIIDLIEKTNKSSSYIIDSILNSQEGGLHALESFDLCQVLSELEKTYQVTAMKKNITLNLFLNEDLMIRVCRNGIVRILDNLISNAVKYSRVGGLINIRAFHLEGEVKVLISDSGPGFSKEDIDNMFDRSSVLTAKPTGNESSHGLGLYIVQKLSNEMGIKVELIESSNMGSTFEVVIPNS